MLLEYFAEGAERHDRVVLEHEQVLVEPVQGLRELGPAVLHHEGARLGAVGHGGLDARVPDVEFDNGAVEEGTGLVELGPEELWEDRRRVGRGEMRASSWCVRVHASPVCRLLLLPRFLCSFSP